MRLLFSTFWTCWALGLHLAAVSRAEDFKIGIIHGSDSMLWHNARYAIDEWNNANAVASDVSFTLVAAVDGHAGIDDRICDVMQRRIVALLVDSEAEPADEIRLAYSMCENYRIPCINLSPVDPPGKANFVTSVIPQAGIFGRAAAQLISSLGWSSYLLIYKEPDTLREITDLLSVWRNDHGMRTAFRVLQLPEDPNHYEVFLKYVREKLKATNIVLHSADLSTVNALLSAASFLNMTESQRYNFVFTNPDLVLLDDFFQSLRPIYRCNITGFQLVQPDPRIKTGLALTVDAVDAIGSGLRSLLVHGNRVVPEVLLCDSDDFWADGQLVSEAIRQVVLQDGLTGRVSFDGRGRRRSATLIGITRADDGFHKLGVYDSEKDKWQFEAAYRQRWRVNVNSSSMDLQGQRLKVVVYLEEPFVTRSSNGIGYDGFCIDLLIEMSKVLNFTFDIVEVEDGAYGVEDEKWQFNGIIGVLQRREADLSVSAVTITYSRTAVIDFTLPFMHLGIAILLGKDIDDSMSRSTSNSLFTFLEPLSFSVWMALGISYLSVGTTMWLLARFSPYEWYDVELIDQRDTTVDGHKNQFTILNALWFAIGSLMQQGSDVIPRAAATRTVAVIWWLFTLILISSYTAQLAAFLTMERMTTPIESAQDLSSQTRIKFGTLKNGSTMDFFRESRIPIYERMWSLMQGQTPSVFVNSSKEAIARVKAGNYAYMMESSMLEYYMKTDCQLTTIGGLLDSKGYGVALPRGSPLRNVLSKTVLQLQERTILEALKNKWWNRDQDSPMCPQKAESNRRATRIFGVYFVLLAGLCVSFLIAIGEYCVESRSDSMRLSLTLMWKLFNSLFRWQDRVKKPAQPPTNDAKGRPQLTVTRLDALATAKDLQSHPPPPANDPSPIRALSRLMTPSDSALLNRRISTASR